jgi:uncharacterized iron-regulated membrane protein
MRRLARQAQRWLYLVHRWIGIATCILFALWFFSGVVMMYVAFPTLTDSERRALLPSIDWQKVKLTPEQALAAAGQHDWPHSLRLEMLGAEPVYRLMPWDHSRVTISAVDGRKMTQVEADQAPVLLSRVSGGKARVTDTVFRDQWTVTARFDALRPFHLVALNDAAGTELYVSSRTGEVALDTTRRERFWNWFGSIPHWIYLTPIRTDNSLWRQVILWTSGPAVFVAVTGIWIGIQRLRRRYARGSMSPYVGWMLWHHWAGIIGSIFLLVWIFSGWLSVNPNQWFTRPGTDPAAYHRYMGNSEARFPLAVSPQDNIVEMRLLWVTGQPVTMAHRADGGRVSSRELDVQTLVQSAARLVPEAQVVRHELIARDDLYWYSHHTTRPLPVLRVVFDDAAGTWFHIDPATGDILQRQSSRQRIYRWLFNALHSFDFRFLLAYRPAWDILLWAMSIVGLVMSVSGIVIGWRHLSRKVSR